MSALLQVEQRSIVRFDPTTNDYRGTATVWHVFIANNMVNIGWIAWYWPWHSFAYFTHSNEIFEEIRLRQIADFCEQKTKKHNQEIQP